MPHGNDTVDLLYERNQALTAELDALRQWKREAIEVIARWDEAYERSGIQAHGDIGRFKSLLMLRTVEKLRAELDAYRMATGGLDPRLVYRIMERAQTDLAEVALRREANMPAIGSWLLSDLERIEALVLRMPDPPSAGEQRGDP